MYFVQLYKIDAFQIEMYNVCVMINKIRGFVGKKWHDRRKVITPAFHFNILETFAEVFDRLGNSVVDKLKQYDANDNVEFYPIAVLYALDVMCGECFVYFYWTN